MSDPREPRTIHSRTKRLAPWSRRIFAVGFGVLFAGTAVAAPVWIRGPGSWTSWFILILILPVGFFLIFYGIRGRAEDLKEFTAKEFAKGILGELLGWAIGAIVILVGILLWRLFG